MCVHGNEWISAKEVWKCHRIEVTLTLGKPYIEVVTFGFVLTRHPSYVNKMSGDEESPRLPPIDKSLLSDEEVEDASPRLQSDKDLVSDDEESPPPTDNSFLSDGELMASHISASDWGRWIRNNSSLILPDVKKGPRESPEQFTSNNNDVEVNEEVEEGLIMLVGPEKVTRKVGRSLAHIVPQGIRVDEKETLSPEEAGLLQHEDCLYILYVMDADDPAALTAVDEQLTFLHKNYSLSFDCMDFILAKEHPSDAQLSSPTGRELKTFMEKHNRPVITVTFTSEPQQCGDESNLQDQMKFFLRRFNTQHFSI